MKLCTETDLIVLTSVKLLQPRNARGSKHVDRAHAGVSPHKAQMSCFTGHGAAAAEVGRVLEGPPLLLCAHAPGKI
jgi:hypothetical protein